MSCQVYSRFRNKVTLHLLNTKFVTRLRRINGCAVSLLAKVNCQVRNSGYKFSLTLIQKIFKASVPLTPAGEFRCHRRVYKGVVSGFTPKSIRSCYKSIKMHKKRQRSMKSLPGI